MMDEVGNGGAVTWWSGGPNERKVLSIRNTTETYAQV